MRDVTAYVEDRQTSEFYPTPEKLVNRMFDKVKWDYVETLLEPSAGKGDILKGLATARIRKQQRDRETAVEFWNRSACNDCTDDDTAEWIYKEVRGTMTNVCSACGSCSVYPDKYCGGCGRSMKNGY